MLHSLPANGTSGTLLSLGLPSGLLDTTLAQMAQSSHPDIVTKICSNRASKYMAWNSLGGGHCIHYTDLAQVMVHLVELVLQVKIYVYLTSAAEQWSLEELTWADPKNLTPEYLLHTIDLRIAHQTELPSALAKELRYNTAPGWYLNRKKHTTHISARRPETKPVTVCCYTL